MEKFKFFLVELKFYLNFAPTNYNFKRHETDFELSDKRD